MAQTSEAMEKYFVKIDDELNSCLKVATEARKQGKDPEDKVDIPLARSMAERVQGLISNVSPKLAESGMTKRIHELEKKHTPQSWEIALIIAGEVAKEKFCKFKDKKEAIELGIRVGMAYSTSGIVSAPLEGFVEAKIKKRADGKEYLAISYAGPIRGAGGTAAAVSVLISDYVRTKMGLEAYDPTDNEVKRYCREIGDYHERVTNLQYFPSDDELEFLAKHVPVEITGDPTEKLEVSNYKDLPRVETNLIRGGMCLVMAEGVAQKAPKLWKRLSVWGEDMDLNWGWMEEFLILQKKIKAKKQDKNESKEKISPNYTFIADLVAGRPVLAYPLREGGFRLRYGRSRNSGYSSAALNPATMWILNNFVAVGTQLKVERPGKAASITSCDELEGPIVKLNDGTVLKVNDEETAKKVHKEVEKILYLGDILFNYGDFSENNHVLVPPGYCPEWWVLELEKITVELFGSLDMEKLSELISISAENLKKLLKNPITSKISFRAARQICEKVGAPLHPDYVYFWKLISKEELYSLFKFYLDAKKVKEENIEKIIFKNNPELKLILEKLGVPHKVVNNEFIILDKIQAQVIEFVFSKDPKEITTIINTPGEVIKTVEKLTNVIIRDKAGTFIGARMGRPEKAKMRKLTGSPHALFPVGEEGGRFKSFQSAVEKKKVQAQFPVYYCEKCKREEIYPYCIECNSKCKKMYYCKEQGMTEKEICNDKSTARTFRYKEINVNRYFDLALKQLKLKVYPDVIKGVKGTSNKDHIPENLIKGILRAKHGIYVNKDGTTRYDMTELAITHFTPKEIQAPIEKLRKLGYLKDIKGHELENENQILEIKPQDLILPCSENSLEDAADKILFKVANFVDELLVRFYGLKPYYNLKKPTDLIGHLVIGLAPHISAGTVGRIIGFSETQGCFAHPLFHAALRRDCFDYDTYIPILNKEKNWDIKKIGDIVEKLNPKKIVDNYGTQEIKVKDMNTLGDSEVVKINNFTRHTPTSMIEIKTASGKKIKTTYNHKHLVNHGKIRKAFELKIGDKINLPYNINIPKKNIKFINLFNFFKNEDWVMVRGINQYYDISKEAKNYFTKNEYYNFIKRDSYPIKFIDKIKEKLDISKFFLSAKRDIVKIPTMIELNEDLLKIIGLYISEGYSREIENKLYQVYIAAANVEIKNFIGKVMKNSFGLVKSENKLDRMTYSSRILYNFFTKLLKCGSNAYEKRIPSIFLNLSNKKLGYLLSGYFEGDGSVSISDNRVTFDTVSQQLLKDLDFVFAQMNIFIKNYEYTSLPGGIVKEFYIKKRRDVPYFKITKGIIQSIFVKKFSKYINFISSRKKKILSEVLKKKAIRIRQEYDNNYIYDKIVKIELLPEEKSYSLNVDKNKVVVNSMLSKQCDGDENCVMLVMDSFLNFSRQFLPDRRGSRTMDSPLVLTARLIPSEVDDMAHGLDIVWKYPLEFYEAAVKYKSTKEIKIKQIKHELNTPGQYEGMGFTHNISSINKGVLISAYKTLPTMQDKLKGQMNLAEKINAVNVEDVAAAVIQKHFLKDIKGNLRKFSQQKFRCVACNEKYRRPPLIGKCTKCNGKIIFTISEGSVGKYLEPSISLAKKYNVSNYLKQVLELTKRNFESVFGRDKEKQTGLGEWFG